MNFWWVFSLFLLVPILVHLFDFRRAKRYYFSSVRFISQLSTRTKSKSRLKYYLLLANRILQFTCIVFFVWILTTRQNRVSNQKLSIYFDNSLSSRLSDNYESLLRDYIGEKQVSNSPIMMYTNEGSVSIRERDWDLLWNQSLGHVSFYQPRFEDIAIEVSKSTDVQRKDILFLSDLQGVEIAAVKNDLSDSLNRYYLIIPHDLNSRKNVMIDSLIFHPNPDELTETSIKVTFESFNMASENLVVKLNQGGRQLSSIVKNVSELKELQFSIPSENHGDFSLEIDGDEVGYDNVFLFTIDNKQKPRIGIIGDKQAELIHKVFGNGELFEVTRQESGNLVYDELSNSDLIILNDLTELPASFIDQFPETSFLIFPNDSADLLSYQEFLDIDLSTSSIESAELDIDYQHPLFRGVFEEDVDEALMTKVRPLFQLNGDYESIVKYRGGNSFLLKKDRIYFFNSSIGSLVGFQSSALFLPIMYQIAFSESGDVGIPYYYPGENVVVAGQPSDNPVRMVNGEVELIPSFNSNGSELVLELPESIAPGFYTLIQNSDTLRQIAINASRQESIMKAPTLEELKDAFADVKNVEIIEAFNQSPEKTLLASTEQSSLWKYALILALLFVLTETMLHRFLK